MSKEITVKNRNLAPMGLLLAKRYPVPVRASNKKEKPAARDILIADVAGIVGCRMAVARGKAL